MTEAETAATVAAAYTAYDAAATAACAPAWETHCQRWDGGNRQQQYNLVNDTTPELRAPLLIARAAFVAAVEGIDWRGAGFEIKTAAYRAAAWHWDAADPSKLKWAGWNNQWSNYRKFDNSTDTPATRLAAVEACIRWVRELPLAPRWFPIQ